MALPIRFERSQYPEQSLHGRIVHAIGRRILSGDLRPGDLLPAEPDLGASRTVVREAVKVLAAKGLVESRPKTGTRVRPRDAWNLLDPDVLAWQQDGAVDDALLRKLTEVTGSSASTRDRATPIRSNCGGIRTGCCAWA